MAKYANTLEELRDTRNFAKLATVYRYLAKFRDGIAAAAPNAQGALDPTLKHLDKTLKDYRDLASEITGYTVQDSDLRINLGDEFGAAGTPDTGQHAGSDTSKIDVIRGLAAAQPFDESQLKPFDINSVAVTTSNAAALYGSGPGGALSFVTKAQMGSREGEYSWDALTSLYESDPMVKEARGCLNQWLIGAAIAGGIAVIALIAIFLWWGGDDDDAGENVIGGKPTATAVVEQSGLLRGLPAATQNDLDYLSSSIAGIIVAGDDEDEPLVGAYTEEDPVDDAFNSFGDDVTFTDDLTELVAGYGGRFNIHEDTGLELTCGEQTSTGMAVVCAEGVTGALPAGDYVVLVGSVDKPLEGWDAAVEYKFSAFLEDRGRTLAFPDGDPRPEFPYNTLIRTNSFFSLGSIGGGTWTLTTRWSEGQQFRPWAAAPATDNAESYVRAALGGNTFVFVAPSELYSDMTHYNVGTEAHPAGEEYTAQNTTQDVIGDNPQATKPLVWNVLTLDRPTEIPEQTLTQFQTRVDQYFRWVGEGNGAEISGHLDRAAKLRWGEDKCAEYFGRVETDDTFAVDILDVRGPVTWDWEIYGIRVGTLYDAYEFDVDVTQRGATQQATVHFAWDLITDDIRVYSPCVTPEEAAAELAAAQAPPTGAPPPGTAPPAAGPDVDRIRSLIADYEMARRDGSPAVADYLHPVVLAYYGEDVCRDFYENEIQPDPTFAFGAETRVSGPAAYTYMPGGVTVGSTDGVYSFVIDTTIGGQTQPFTWRFALVRGELKIFQPCRR